MPARWEQLEERRLLATVAADDFESGNFDGGSEQWASGGWTVAGDASIRTDNSPHAGTYHARLRRGTGDLQRTVDVSGLQDVKLQFWSKLKSFEGSDRAYVKVSGDGAGWTTLATFVNGQDDNQYYFFSLNVPDVGDTLHIRFDAAMSGGKDYWYLDDVSIVGTAGGAALFVSDGQLTEGDSGTANLVFSVSRSGDISQASTVDFATAPGTATAGIDFIGTSGMLTFPADDGNSQTITVQIVGDTDPEEDENFFVNLSNASGGVIADDQGEGVILNDDNGISISDGTIAEDGSADAFVPAASGGLDNAKGLALRDGKLYVASANNDSILRYNDATGDLVDTFVASGSGGLDNPVGMDFGPDGHLYVSSSNTDQILRYNGTTGAFIDAFVPAGGGGLDAPRDLMFREDGHLYVSSGGTDQVLRFDVTTGNPEVFVGDDPSTPGIDESGGLDSPVGFDFDSTGNFYLGGLYSNNVLKFDGNGAFLSTFIPSGSGGLDGVVDPDFGPDGHLYVSGIRSHQVLRFDGTTGALIDEVINGDDAGIVRPRDILFDSTGNLFASGQTTDNVVRYSEGLVVNLSAASTTTVTVDFATADGTAEAGADYTALTGTLTIAPGETSKRILLAAIDDVDVEGDQTFHVNLANATGDASITDGQGTSTVTDDDTSRMVTIGDVIAKEGDNAPHYRGPFIDGLPGASFNPLTFGPDGYAYTSVATGEGYNTIQRFDAATGAFVDTFMDNSSPDHKIDGVRDIVFHPSDGLVYVASAYTDEVLRYDSVTGDFVDVFVIANSGGIDHPDGMMFGPDSNGDGNPELYVTGWLSHSVVRYDGATGQPLGSYISAGSGGLSFPFSLALRAGELFVTSAGTDQVLKYDAATGDYIGVAASTGLDYPRGLTLGPDDLLYVTSGDNDRIVRYTPGGVYVDDYVPAGTGGLDDPRTPRFGPDGNLYVTVTGKSEIMRFGTENEAILTVVLSQPSSLPLTVDYGTADGSALAGGDYVAVGGTLTFSAGMTSRFIRVPLVDDEESESTEDFTVNLSNATGAVIQYGQGVVSINDDDGPADPTKFYVVDDSADDMFEYQADGSLVENYSLGTGNNAPRGAAATAAGDTVWVIDNDDHVYVHNNDGQLLSSWKARGLDRPEGIASDGTDVWIVDRGNDRVHYFAGGATRTTDGDSTSTFSLAAGNPRGVTTDGTHLWVVDTGTDRVYKYTTGGSFLGSWGLDGRNTVPRGITINPGNVGDIWVIDSTDDDIYEYTAAAGRISGSQAAGAVYGLAGGNTNPQGIADPPPPKPSMRTTSSSVVPSVEMALATVGGSRQVFRTSGQAKTSALEPLSPAAEGVIDAAALRLMRAGSPELGVPGTERLRLDRRAVDQAIGELTDGDLLDDRLSSEWACGLLEGP